MTEIALRSGFRSLRRFNNVFAEVYKRPPTEIRRARTRSWWRFGPMSTAATSHRSGIERQARHRRVAKIGTCRRCGVAQDRRPSEILPIGARGGLRHHSGTAKQQRPSSSAVVRHYREGPRASAISVPIAERGAGRHIGMRSRVFGSIRRIPCPAARCSFSRHPPRPTHRRHHRSWRA